MMVVVMMMMVIKICHDVNGSANDYDGNDVTLMVMDDDGDEDDDGNSGGGGGSSSGSRVWQGYIFPIGSLLPAEDERKSSCICRLP